MAVASAASRFVASTFALSTPTAAVLVLMAMTSRVAEKALPTLTFVPTAQALVVLGPKARSSLPPLTLLPTDYRMPAVLQVPPFSPIVVPIARSLFRPTPALFPLSASLMWVLPNTVPMETLPATPLQWAVAAMLLSYPQNIKFLVVIVAMPMSALELVRTLMSDMLARLPLASAFPVSLLILQSVANPAGAEAGIGVPSFVEVDVCRGTLDALGWSLTAP